MEKPVKPQKPHHPQLVSVSPNMYISYFFTPSKGWMSNQQLAEEYEKYNKNYYGYDAEVSDNCPEFPSISTTFSFQNLKQLLKDFNLNEDNIAIESQYSDYGEERVACVSTGFCLSKDELAKIEAENASKLKIYDEERAIYEELKGSYDLQLLEYDAVRIQEKLSAKRRQLGVIE